MTGDCTLLYNNTRNLSTIFKNSVYPDEFLIHMKFLENVIGCFRRLEGKKTLTFYGKSKPWTGI